MTGRTTELLPCISRRAAGGSPLFPPEHSSEAEAREAVMDLVRRTPRSMGLGRTRWTLGLLAQEMKAVGDIPEDITRGGFSKLLGRLGISYKRGRQRMRSPDPDYDPTTKKGANTPLNGSKRLAPTQM